MSESCSFYTGPDLVLLVSGEYEYRYQHKILLPKGEENLYYLEVKGGNEVSFLSWLKSQDGQIPSRG